MSLTLKIEAFSNGGEIPKKFTCSGRDVSPALMWTGVPSGAHSLALIVEDPDAPGGVWTHWLIWNIPVQASDLPEGVPGEEVLANGAHQGTNDFKRVGYGGPCPPPGKPHRYFFKLYVLDTRLNLPATTRKRELEALLKGHILAQMEYMGTYQR